MLDWSVRYEKDKVIISMVLDSMELYFNPCTGRVDDVTVKRHLVSMADILMIAEDMRRLIRLPELVDTEGLKRVKSDCSIYVDPTDKKFRKSMGELASGYANLV